MSDKVKKSLSSKWDPFLNEMAALKKVFDEKFENFLSTHPFSMKIPSIWQGRLGVWRPEVDVYETEREVVIEANVPGIDKEDMRININNNILTISGEKKEEKEVKNKNYFHKEQYFGSFSRSLSLPHYADIQKAKASCERGILKIEFPKAKSSGGKSKRIHIS